MPFGMSSQELKSFCSSVRENLNTNTVKSMLKRDNSSSSDIGDIPVPANKPFIGDTSLITAGASTEETSLMGHTDVVINCAPTAPPTVGKRRSKAYYGSGGYMDHRALIEQAGKRLSQRKKLYIKKRFLSKIMMVLALTGIMLMMVENEMIINGVYDKSSAASAIVKLAITISTLVLLGSITYYHVCEIEMYLIENNLEDWRYAANFKRIVHLGVELIVCAIHPPPGEHDFQFTTQDLEGKDVTVPYPVDVILSLPMFLRVYIFCRFAMLHAPLFSDAKSQSLGALNRIHFNFAFIFKSYMAMYPGSMLALIIISVYLGGSWTVRACEMYNYWVDATMANSLWLIAITVLTIGYGDITPKSTCGRAMAVVSGTLGVACTALVVAVLAKMLELNRKESYVHGFVLDVHLEKSYKNCAQLVIREAWKVHKWRKKGQGYRVRVHMQKLLKNISLIRKVREDKNRMKNSDITLNEVSVQQSMIQGLIHHIYQKQSTNETRLEQLERTLQIVSHKIGDMHTLVMSRRPPSSASSSSSRSGGTGGGAGGAGASGGGTAPTTTSSEAHQYSTPSREPQATSPTSSQPILQPQQSITSYQ